MVSMLARARVGAWCGPCPASCRRDGGRGAPLPRQSPPAVDDCAGGATPRRCEVRGRSARPGAAGRRSSPRRSPPHLVRASCFLLFPPNLIPGYTPLALPATTSATPRCPPLPAAPPPFPSSSPSPRLPFPPPCRFINPFPLPPWPVGTPPPRRRPPRGGPSGWASVSRHPSRRQHPMAATA